MAGSLPIPGTRTREEREDTSSVQNGSSSLQPQYHELIIAVHAEEKIKYGSLAAVKALSGGATLLEILGAVREAAAPKRGRKPNASATDDATGGISAANNWVDGGYSPEAMDGQVSFGARTINASRKRSQADILEATNLMTRGFARTLTEHKAFRPSKRPGAVACSSTGALHAAQLNEYEVEEAAENVYIWFPHCDAGAKREKSAMLVGGRGLLKVPEQ